jgi:hypothetical protein
MGGIDEEGEGEDEAEVDDAELLRGDGAQGGVEAPEAEGEAQGLDQVPRGGAEASGPPLRGLEQLLRDGGGYRSAQAPTSR